MSDDFKRMDTEKIKAAYRADQVSFVEAMLAIVRRAGHTPHEAQLIVYDLVKEKHNGPRARDK